MVLASCSLHTSLARSRNRRASGISPSFRDNCRLSEMSFDLLKVLACFRVGVARLCSPSQDAINLAIVDITLYCANSSICFQILSAFLNASSALLYLSQRYGLA
jgi:hypothetical protein